SRSRLGATGPVGRLGDRSAQRVRWIAVRVRDARPSTPVSLAIAGRIAHQPTVGAGGGAAGSAGRAARQVPAGGGDRLLVGQGGGQRVGVVRVAAGAGQLLGDGVDLLLGGAQREARLGRELV